MVACTDGAPDLTGLGAAPGAGSTPDGATPAATGADDAEQDEPTSPRGPASGAAHDGAVTASDGATGVGAPGNADATVLGDAGAVSTPPDGVPSAEVWKPGPGTSWQWDLSGDVAKLDGAADVYDIDGFATDAALVAQLHAMGKKAICYLSVGTYEPDRPDAKDFPKEGLGKYWPEWGETYIDIRSSAVRAIIAKRLDMCKSKGFDGVEPDNMDMFEGGMSDTGFPLTEADGIAYAKWLASEVHARKMSIGQKNASSITSAIEGLYDWGLTEDCFADGWCDEMKAYPGHGKALFMCEYTDTKVDFKAACSAAKKSKFSAILKKRDLDSWVQRCE